MKITQLPPVSKTEGPEVVAHRQLPAPGKPLSFEEALKLTMDKYDNALKELAK